MKQAWTAIHVQKHVSTMNGGSSNRDQKVRTMSCCQLWTTFTLCHNPRAQHFISTGSPVIVGSPSSTRKTALIQQTDDWMCNAPHAGQAFQDRSVLTTDSTTQGHPQLLERLRKMWGHIRRSCQHFRHKDVRPGVGHPFHSRDQVEHLDTGRARCPDHR